ncbi:hypothetical protein ACLF6K_36090 [Streptomyces xanthophaeus]
MSTSNVSKRAHAAVRTSAGSARTYATPDSTTKNSLPSPPAPALPV